jgi:ABC-type dipeptide/oligopeptide/nickel transport system permease component
MLKYILRRFLWSIPVMLGVSLITFVLMHLAPGGPWDVISTKVVRPEVKQAMARTFGLDKPFHVQYINYMLSAARGDLGPSYSDTRSVAKVIADEFPLSAAFGSSALVIGALSGIAFGLLSALRRNRLIDRIGAISFVLAISLILIFAVNLHLVNVQFQRDRWQSWILPLFLLSLHTFALMTRLVRSTALDILGEDYIRTAHVKGLTRLLVWRRHVLRNALLPIMTLLGPLAANLLTGSFIVESIFGIPGLGRTFVSSIVNRDYPLVMGTTLFFAALLIAFNLLVDLSYLWIDPRIVFS